MLYFGEEVNEIPKGGRYGKGGKFTRVLSQAEGGGVKSLEICPGGEFLLWAEFLGTPHSNMRWLIKLEKKWHDGKLVDRVKYCLEELVLFNLSNLKAD